MADVEFDPDGLDVHGLLGTQRIAYANIRMAVVRREAGLKSSLTAEDLVISLTDGTEIEIGRKLHVTYDGTAPGLHELADQINKQAQSHRPPLDLPTEVAADVASDLQQDDRPWWEQG